MARRLPSVTAREQPGGTRLHRRFHKTEFAMNGDQEAPTISWMPSMNISRPDELQRTSLDGYRPGHGLPSTRIATSSSQRTPSNPPGRLRTSMDRHHGSPTSTSGHRPKVNPSERVSRNENIFALQALTLDAAVAPSIRKPTAPFAKSERKRAYTSATYYSECFVRGISPVDADTAALDAQDQYEKW